MKKTQHHYIYFRLNMSTSQVSAKSFKILYDLQLSSDTRFKDCLDLACGVSEIRDSVRGTSTEVSFLLGVLGLGLYGSKAEKLAAGGSWSKRVEDIVKTKTAIALLNSPIARCFRYENSLTLRGARTYIRMSVQLSETTLEGRRYREVFGLIDKGKPISKGPIKEVLAVFGVTLDSIGGLDEFSLISM